MSDVRTIETRPDGTAYGIDDVGNLVSGRTVEVSPADLDVTVEQTDDGVIVTHSWKGQVHACGTYNEAAVKQQHRDRFLGSIEKPTEDDRAIADAIAEDVWNTLAAGVPLDRLWGPAIVDGALGTAERFLTFTEWGSGHE